MRGSWSIFWFWSLIRLINDRSIFNLFFFSFLFELHAKNNFFREASFWKELLSVFCIVAMRDSWSIFWFWSLIRLIDNRFLISFSFLFSSNYTRKVIFLEKQVSEKSYSPYFALLRCAIIDRSLDFDLWFDWSMIDFLISFSFLFSSNCTQKVIFF